VHQGGTTWILDIGVVCPGTKRYVDQGSQTTPGRVAEAYAAIKAAKDADQPNFVPLIVETGGCISRWAHLFLDSTGSRPAADSRTQGHFRGPSPHYVDQGSQTTPGRAAEAYTAIKAAKDADQPNFVPLIVETGGYINRRAHLFLDSTGSRRRLPDPGALQGTVTPRRRAQGGEAGSGSYPSLHAHRHCSGDSRGRPRR
jgi:hypothetical protein